MYTEYEKIETDTLGGLRIAGWELTSSHQAILNHKEIEDYASQLGFNVPEMIFGNNYLRIAHGKTGAQIELNALDALRQVDTSPESAKTVQVSIASGWSASSQRNRADITDVIRPFDWTLSTKYRGTLTNLRFEQTTQGIDYSKLQVREPIHFYDENVLYEDDLGDNGTSQLSYKVRVMSSGFFVLQRFFMRVDGVLFRIYDTRMYHAFGSEVVLREFSTREAPFDEVRKMLPLKNRDDEDLSLLNNIVFVDSVMKNPKTEYEIAHL
ncbi:Tap42 interacting protein [Coemansia sp. Benny D115]|nr:Tap42 interacting protein [Coemansia sp. Benny D115]